MRVLNQPLANFGSDLPQRGHTMGAAAATIVDDHDFEGGPQLRNNPWRVEVVQRCEVSHDAPVLRPLGAPSEEGGELAIDAIRAAICFHHETARLARRGEVPLA